MTNGGHLIGESLMEGGITSHLECCRVWVVYDVWRKCQKMCHLAMDGQAVIALAQREVQVNALQWKSLKLELPVNDLLPKFRLINYAVQA